VSLRNGGWLAPHSLVIVEEAADSGFTAPQGYAEVERRRYDDTEFTFLRKG
jgi:16S rRNA (guanine966-N2)-methyltransferase